MTEILVEGDVYRWHVPIAVDAAELIAASIIPAAQQRRAIFPFCQF